MEKIRIQDDLYTYVNQAKLDELVIPEDMPMAGGFAALSTDVEKLMIGEFNAMCKEGNYPNEYLERACTLFKLAKDVKRKKKHGIKPALKNLAVIKKLGTMRSYNLRAKELIFTCDYISADEAYRIGLANKVVPQEELMDTCIAMAEKILSKGSYAISLAKMCIETGMDTDLDSGLDMEATNFGLAFATGDKKEGMTAFLEKRPANLTDF